MRFTPAVGRGTLFYVSEARTRFMGDVSGPGAPFGTLEMPPDDAPCENRLRFSGWALDDHEVTRVFALRDRGPADPPGAAPQSLQEGTWARGSRPDVAAQYEGFPHADRSEWNIELDCRAFAAQNAASIHIR